MSKKDAQKLLEAAKLIDSGKEEFSCYAVDEAGRWMELAEERRARVTRYVNLMYSGWWWGGKKEKYLDTEAVEKAARVRPADYYGGSYKEKMRNFRVLMLCMAAAVMEEDDDL